ncbi:hypothetical protein C1645_831141 [Glomus cerebriforme]|uniref:HCP-like protein n=1 Tax=Glomus cerebriforme TaxID=658196 RepID=A0A397SJY6_9GLOM|nr:hypothetical protein C1645_831141 [Glomus cerebriforme]
MELDVIVIALVKTSNKIIKRQLNDIQNHQNEEIFRVLCILGYCYDYKDKKKAFELYLKSAEKGHKLSSCMVGNYYHYEKGILKDESKPFEWYLKGAKKGRAYSQYLLANYYNDGIYFSKDEEDGFYWNRKALSILNIEGKLEIHRYEN